MIGIGTGTIALGAGAGNWAARDPVARNAHLYFSPATGRYARAGAPASFSQMGTFEAAGTRYQRNRNSPLLSPVGVDVPRISDHLPGDRRWSMAGAIENLSAPLASPENFGDSGSLTLMPDEVGPDGNTGAVYRLQLPATSSTFVTVYGGSNGDTVNSSVWAKAYTPGANEEFYLIRTTAIDPVRLHTAAARWERHDEVFGPGSNTGISNGDDDIVTDILIWGPQVTIGSALLPFVQPQATSAPEYFKSDLTGFDLSGGVGAFFHGTLHANATLYDRILDFGDEGGNDRYLLRHQASQDELYLVHQTNGVSVGGVSTSYTLGTEFKAALLFGAGADATVFILNGDVIGTLSPASYDAPLELRVASNHDQSDNHPMRLDTAALDVFAYDHYSIAELQARTAA